jgi:uncharacterized protein (TIGR03000 family)
LDGSHRLKELTMSLLQTFRRPCLTPTRASLAVAALFLAAAATWAGPGYPGHWKSSTYAELHPPTQPPAVVTLAPVKYTIHVYVDFHPGMPADTNIAKVVAHLPEGAPLWVEDMPTRQRGMVRHFESPPLKERGHRYTYTARVVWFEDGKWVSQTQEVPVWAGKTTCLYLTKPDAETVALDELGREDRKLAKAQRFCAVQPDNRLGAMGKPVKVMVKGKPVFLCCEDCVKQALSAPDQTQAKASELRAKSAKTPAK